MSQLKEMYLNLCKQLDRKPIRKLNSMSDLQLSRVYRRLWAEAFFNLHQGDLVEFKTYDRPSKTLVGKVSTVDLYHNDEFVVTIITESGNLYHRPPHYVKKLELLKRPAHVTLNHNSSVVITRPKEGKLSKRAYSLSNLSRASQKRLNRLLALPYWDQSLDEHLNKHLVFGQLELEIASPKPLKLKAQAMITVYDNERVEITRYESSGYRKSSRCYALNETLSRLLAHPDWYKDDDYIKLDDGNGLKDVKVEHYWRGVING